MRKMQTHERRTAIAALIAVTSDYDRNLCVPCEFDTIRRKTWRGNMVSVSRRSGGTSMPVHLATIYRAHEANWKDPIGAVAQVLHGILSVA